MITIAFPIMLALCMLSAMVLIYKWYAQYAKHKKLFLKDVFGNGKYRPKYIKPDESPFSKEVTNRLNMLLSLIFVSMGIGVVLAITFDFLN